MNRKLLIAIIASVTVIALVLTIVLAVVLCNKENDEPNPAPTQYTVSFNTDGGSLVAEQKVNEGGKAAMPATNPKKTGYNFEGWFNSFEKTVDFDEIINSDTTIYAKWAAKTVLVSFDFNGGDEDETETDKVLTYDTTYGILPTTTKMGYNFDGWFVEVIGGAQVLETTVVKNENNHTLHAQWTAISGIKVSFETYGGTGTAIDIFITYDSQYGTLPNGLIKTGYTFGGWWMGINGTGEKITNKTVAKTATAHILYAKWIPNDNVIIFNGNGNTDGTMSDQTIATGDRYSSAEFK